jgi:hypothetical protein
VPTLNPETAAIAAIVLVILYRFRDRIRSLIVGAKPATATIATPAKGLASLSDHDLVTELLARQNAAAIEEAKAKATADALARLKGSPAAPASLPTAAPTVAAPIVNAPRTVA